MGGGGARRHAPAALPRGAEWAPEPSERLRRGGKKLFGPQQFAAPTTPADSLF